MAAIAVTASNVRLVYDQGNTIRTRKLNSAMDAGASVYLMSTGKAEKCDANDAGKEQFAGIALEGGAANQSVSVIEEGAVQGFDLSGLAIGALVYQNDTAGGLDTAASATKTVIVGKVDVVLEADGTLNKVLHVFRNRIANF